MSKSYHKTNTFFPIGERSVAAMAAMPVSRPDFAAALLLMLLVPTISGQGCSWKCPNGRQAEHRAGYKPSSNGCGIDGLRISSQFDFTECCDKHDFVRCRPGGLPPSAAPRSS